MKIAAFTKGKVPYFFKYAKDKNDNEVSALNDSFVNKLYFVIPDRHINTRKLHLGKINHEKMMFNVNTVIDENVIDLYTKLNREYRYKINMKDEERDNLTYVAKVIREEFQNTGYSSVEITDMLVKYLYGSSDKRYKQLLWFIYGNQILENLKRNIRIKQAKIVQCVDCGELFEVAASNNSKDRCDDCYKLYRKNYKKAKELERRNRSFQNVDK